MSKLFGSMTRRRSGVVLGWGDWCDSARVVVRRRVVFKVVILFTEEIMAEEDDSS
jgi:hypothetical protein